MKKFFSKINWANLATTAAVAIVAVVIVYPMIRPILQKIPVVGSRFA